MQVLVVISILIFSVITTHGDKIVEIEPDGVYKIENVFDGGALTVDDRSIDSILVYLREYNSTAGQKWRLTESSIGSSIIFSPTSNERATLDLDMNTLGVWGRIFSFGNQRHWKLISVGEGFVEIQNAYDRDWCLTSQGLDKVVGVADCENSPSQQWVFTLL